jgi:phage gp36-like protein
MYSSIDDMKKLLSESELLDLADDAGSGSLDDDTVQAVLVEAIDAADREIDAYVGTVQTVPLADPVPGLIANISAKLAVNHLYLRRPGVVVPDSWEKESTRCHRLLESIAKGTIVIGAPAGETADPDTSEVLVDAPRPVFSRNAWRGY